MTARFWPPRTCAALALAGRATCLALGALLALACSTPAPASPRAAAPSNVLPLPEDSVLTLRVDLMALRAELGESLARQLLGDMLGSATAAPELLARALERASLLWVATPAREALDAGRVLVLRGRFAGVAFDQGGRAPRWMPAGASAEALQLSAGGRVYRLPGDELLAFAPPAELAAVEQALSGRGEHALRPPERGAVSLAASPEAWLERYSERFPELVERLRGMRRIEAFAEATAGTWRADLLVDFTTAEQAGGASDVLGRLRQALGQRSCAVGALARVLSVSSFERNLRVQAWLENAELETVRACVLGGGCCA